MTILRSVCKSIGMMLALPFILVVFLLFLVLWLISVVTLIGPVWQYFCTISDKTLLDRKKMVQLNTDLHFLHIPHGNNGNGYQLAVRFTPSNMSNHPPVCIPNGLGATMMTISQLHEEFVKRGYSVLSYDRYGVGLSDVNTTGIIPTADDVVRDMEFVLSSFQPPSTAWLIVGPSMGSIVGQYYTACYPLKVAGFLNMDGFPYPFCERRGRFVIAGYIYKAYAAIIWTGIMRPFIRIGIRSLQKHLESKAFPIEVICAQTNESNFFRNLSYEMLTMIDVAEKVNRAWGNQSCLDLDPLYFNILVNTTPSIVADEENGVWSEIDATKVDDQLIPNYGSIDPQESTIAINHLISRQPHSSLTQTWQKLAVCVMSGRNFNSSGANLFIDQQMRDWYAAEHNIHALLAAKGYRIVFPKKAHVDMFQMVGCIGDQLDRVAQNIKALEVIHS